MSKKANKKTLKTVTVVTNLVCVLLMLVFFATQFLPFWSYTTIEGEDKEAELLGITVEPGVEVDRTISLADYVWMTEEHEDLFGNWRRMKLPGTNTPIQQNDIVVMPFLTTLLIVLGCVFCVLKRESTWTCLFPLIAGVYAVVTYLTNTVLQTGANWQIQMAAAAAMTLASLVLAVQWLFSIFRWFTVKK